MARRPSWLIEAGFDHLFKLLRDDTGRTAGAENEAEEQVAFADRLILNKTDLVSPAELATVRARVQPGGGSQQLLYTTTATDGQASRTIQNNTLVQSGPNLNIYPSTRILGHLNACAVIRRQSSKARRLLFPTIGTHTQHKGCE